MYEGEYYRKVLLLNQLKYELEMLLKKQIQLQEDIDYIQKELDEATPTDCRGDSCG